MCTQMSSWPLLQLHRWNHAALQATEKLSPLCSYAGNKGKAGSGLRPHGVNNRHRILTAVCCYTEKLH